MRRLLVGSASDRGAVRPVNEDALILADPVFAVADGMGGHVGGALASRIVADRLNQLAGSKSLLAATVLSCVESANDDIRFRVAKDPELQGMGTTLSGFATVDVGGIAHWMVFNIGDSRVYRWTESSFERLTVDHSEVEELIRAGSMTRAEAVDHPRRNVVTRCLAGADALTDHWIFPREHDEVLLACTDGLFNEVPEPEIEAVLSRSETPQTAADDLLSAALNAGARDNVSVLVVSSHETEEASEVEEDTAPRGDSLSRSA